MFGLLSVFASLFAALAYPMYMTRIVLETPTTSTVEQWMSYWVLYALISTSEWFFGISMFPLYYELKLGLILWLTLPKTKGASVIYTKYVRPRLNKARAAAVRTGSKMPARNPAWDREVLESANQFLQDHNPEMYGRLFKQAQEQVKRAR